MVYEKVFNINTPQTVWVTWLMSEYLEAGAVESIQSVLRAEPKKA